MRENRTCGSEGGEPGNRASLPLSLQRAEQIAFLLDFGAIVCDTQQRSSHQWVTSFLHPNLQVKFQLSAASGSKPPDRTGKKLWFIR